MATLNALKHALRELPPSIPSRTPNYPLTNAQYQTGFGILRSASHQTYGSFIIPELSSVIATLLEANTRITIQEIGPGPESVLACLPLEQRARIKRYVAYEPNELFVAKLEAQLGVDEDGKKPFPGLETSAQINQFAFPYDIDTDIVTEKFDLILFCHSMYGMHSKRPYVEGALKMLEEHGLLIVFHREGLHLDGLVAHSTSMFPHGEVRIDNQDDTLDPLLAYIAGFEAPNNQDLRTRGERARALGRVDSWATLEREEGVPLEDSEVKYVNELVFAAPEVVVMLDRRGAKSLLDLTCQVGVLAEGRKVKNRIANRHKPAAVMLPLRKTHVQRCVRWALENETGLTVIGGGHGGSCVQPNVVAVDMRAFDRVDVITEEDGGPYVVAQSGATTGDIVKAAMEKGLTVPLGARPSVGAGLWLQGGIGHLARERGLACDTIVGALSVNVVDGSLLVVGDVPREHVPKRAIRPDNEDDLLWAIKGAGTNCGIILSVTFEATPAPMYDVRNWILPLADSREVVIMLKDFDRMAREFRSTSSIDAYLY